MRPLNTLIALCLLLPACPPAPAATPTGGTPAGGTPALGCPDKLPGEYTFYFDGMRRYQERTKLTPPGTMEITRTFSGGQTRSCRVELACGAGNIFNVGDVAAALSDPDVQKALSPSAPFFGEDRRPVDIRRRASSRSVSPAAAPGSARPSRRASSSRSRR
jgi:hypothetical protein